VTVDERYKKARKEAEKRHVDEVARHIFLCTGPDCVSNKEGERLWSHLKKQVSDVKERCPEGRIYRSKVGCLRICEQGAVGVVYPEGTWYAGLDREGISRVVREHLVGGKRVDDLVIGQGLRPGEAED
jgi:(2Fe-2S) ferredoxin